MSTQLGQKAEELATQYLQNQGMKILARNWRNRWCEIDVIAVDKPGIIRFVEVKFRHNPAFGSGFEYITYDKAQRLRRAAQAWMQIHYGSQAYQIDVISVMGNLNNPQIEYLSNAVES